MRWPCWPLRSSERESDRWRDAFGDMARNWVGREGRAAGESGVGDDGDCALFVWRKERGRCGRVVVADGAGDEGRDGRAVWGDGRWVKREGGDDGDRWYLRVLRSASGS